MVAVECPVTSTGFRVLTAMFRHRDHGIEDLDRYALVDQHHRQWLRDAHRDGRLQEMARAGEVTGP